MAMRYRKLNESGDMNFGNRQVDFYKDDPVGVVQAVWTRLRLWAGEWFLDLAEGTPYQQSALGVAKFHTIEPAIRQRILETTGVTGIDQLEVSINPDERKVTITATIVTEFGETTLEGVI